MHIGATPPYRACLKRMSEVTTRMQSILRSHRTWAYETKMAQDLFRDTLGLRPGASMQKVIEAYETVRGRPITVEEFPLSSRFTGMCMPGALEDIIVITTRASAAQKAHVTLHELRHLPIPGHDHDIQAEDGGMACSKAGVLDVQTLEAQAAILPPEVVERMRTSPESLRLRSANYADDPLELRPEVFATTIYPLLDLDPVSQHTGSLTSAFSGRRLAR